MKYTINKDNYRDFHTIEINKLLGRSYFIPYPDKKAAMSVEPKQKRYSSPKVVCLNGDYVFDGNLDLSQLFFISDVSDEVKLEINRIEPNLSIAEQVLTSDTEPDIDLDIYCNKP